MYLTVMTNPTIDVCQRKDGKTVSQYCGKGYNVTEAFTAFKKSCLATGFLFSDYAEVFKKKYELFKVDTDFVVCNGQTRVSKKSTDEYGKVTESFEGGSTVDKQELAALIEKLKFLSKGKDRVIISGSLPKGVDDGYYASLVEACQGTSVVVDTSGKRLLHAVKQGVELVKPNLFELEQAVGYKLTDLDKMVKASAGLVEMGAKLVLASFGSAGALITDGKNCYFAEAPKVEAVSEVGAGDAMLAACLNCLDGSGDISDALRCAVAAGTATCLKEGTKLFSKADYDSLLEKITILNKSNLLR